MPRGKNIIDRVKDRVGIMFASPQGEIGATGTQIWAGHILGEEYKSKLDTSYGGEGFDIFNRMRKSDPVVRASLKAIELKIRQGNWFVEAASEDSKDEEIKEFIHGALFDEMSTPWTELIRLILTELPFGFSVFEKVFKEDSGKIYWDKWAYRSPTTIQKFWLSNGKRGIVQRVEGEHLGKGGNEPEVPIEKCLIFVHEKEGENWRGVSLLRSAYKPWFMKEALEKVEAISHERMGVGLPTATQPGNAKPQDITRAKNLLKNIRANEEAYLLKPPGWEFEMMDMKGSSTKDPKEAIERKNWEIAVNILAPHIVLGQKSVGSYALAKELSSDFSFSVQAIAEEIADAINNHAIKQLVDINFGEVKKYPKLRVERIEQVDPEKFAFMMERLVSSGVITVDDTLEGWARDKVDAPEKEELTPEEEKKTDKQDKELELEIKEKKEVEDEEEDRKEVVASEKVHGSFWRPLTAAEKRIDLSKIESAMDSMERRFVNEVGGLLNNEKKELLKFVEEVARLGDPSLILNYFPSYKNQIADKIYDLYMEAFNKGKILAANELKLSAPITKSVYQNAARTRAVGVADKLVNDLVAEVRFAMTDLMEKGVARRELVRNLGEITVAKISTLIARASSSTMVGGINTGRYSVFEGRPEVIHSLQRSEILDTRTCNYCLSIDGRSVYPGDDIAEIEQFHFNCRGIWVAIHKEEVDKPPVTDIPDYLRERVGTLSEFKQLPKARPLKDSLAYDFLQGKVSGT